MDSAGIRTGRLGVRSIPGERLVPNDAEKIFDENGWEIFIDRESGELFFDTNEYHTGTIALSKEALKRLLEALQE